MVWSVAVFDDLFPLKGMAVMQSSCRRAHPRHKMGSNSTTKTRGVVHSLITKVLSRGLIDWPLIAVSASEICLNELVNGTVISSGTHYARISGSSQLSPPNISANALFPAMVFPHISAATAFAVRIGGDI